MQPRDFLQFAEMCLETLPGDAAARSAVSRAYYAAFHTANDYLRQFPSGFFDQLGPGKHQQVIKALESLNHPKTLRWIGTMWNLKGLREVADYQLENTTIEKRSRTAVRNARNLIHWIENLPTPGQT
jgi:uncharacterized protein (UPF0332 family)